MKLYLVQHGVSRPKDEDPQQGLSLEGRTQAKKMAEHLASKGITVGVVYHSPKLRAKQTAEVFAEAIRPGTLQEDDTLKPLDDVSLWVERLNNTDEDTMLVGHLPHLQRLASLLLANDPDAQTVVFRNAGVVCLERTSEGKWQLRWALVPELL